MTARKLLEQIIAETRTQTEEAKVPVSIYGASHLDLEANDIYITYGVDDSYNYRGDFNLKPFVEPFSVTVTDGDDYVHTLDIDPEVLNIQTVPGDSFVPRELILYLDKNLMLDYTKTVLEIAIPAN